MEPKIQNKDWFENNPLEKLELDTCLSRAGLTASEYWMGQRVSVKVIKSDWTITHDNLRLKLMWLVF